MANTILWRSDEDRFELTDIEAVFRNTEGFSAIRLDEPGGALIEAKFADLEQGDRVLVRLSRGSDAISITDASKTSLRVALILQHHLDVPLRVVDTDYSFDLDLSEYSTIDELTEAIEVARRGSQRTFGD